jgi:hypothetical protein
MFGLFRVRYFDPQTRSTNVHAINVIARNVEEAIKKADKDKLLKRYKVENVECLGWSDE